MIHVWIMGIIPSSQLQLYFSLLALEIVQILVRAQNRVNLGLNGTLFKLGNCQGVHNRTTQNTG